MSKSADLQAKIAEEQAAIKTTQTFVTEQRAKRALILMSADDSEIDRIDVDVRKATTRIERSQERVAMLQRALTQAQNDEQRESLEKLVERAKRARIIGEKIIRTHYADAAAKVADALRKLAFIDNVVIEANIQLRRAGRDECVLSPNVIRGREAKVTKRMVKRMMHPGNHEHPDAEFIQRNTVGVHVDKRTGHPVMAQEFELEETTTIPGYMPDSLYDEVELPSVECDVPPIWSKEVAARQDADAGIAKELGLDDSTSGVAAKVKNLIGGKAA